MYEMGAKVCKYVGIIKEMELLVLLVCTGPRSARSTELCARTAPNGIIHYIASRQN